MGEALAPPKAVTVAWLGGASPAAESRRALDAWAAARGLKVALPAPFTPPHVPVDPAVGDAVEEDLAVARDAMVASGPEAVERALVHAQALLDAHPELPQAGWLRAEVERAWAVRWLRLKPADPTRAAEAWARAQGLDGGRAPGAFEPPAGAAGLAEVALRFRLAPGVEGDVRLAIDGRLLPGGREVEAKRTPGRHQLVALARGGTVWAGWVDVTDQGDPIDVPLPKAPPCTAPDLARAAASERGAVAVGVECERWVLVVPTSRPDTLRVATCEGPRCGALVEWRTPEPTPPAPRVPPGPGGPTKPPPRAWWPAWATWALVGTGVGVLGGVALALSGAFDPAKREAQFVSGGLVVHTFR